MGFPSTNDLRGLRPLSCENTGVADESFELIKILISQANELRKLRAVQPPLCCRRLEVVAEMLHAGAATKKALIALERCAVSFVLVH